MSISVTMNASLAPEPVHCEYAERQWYAVYTCANHEKRIATQFNERSIEHFLPLYEAVRRWKDRRMRIEIPLFPGYIFVHHSLQDRLQILQVPGVVRLVGFNNLTAPLPNEDIETLRRGLKRSSPAEPHPYLTAGRHVRIVRGPFEGLEGILVRRKGKLRVVLSIHLIMRSVAIDVDAADVHVVR
jgi:transcription antitermination factor NusG